jgi:hypothetical protein
MRRSQHPPHAALGFIIKGAWVIRQHALRPIGLAQDTLEHLSVLM